MKHTIAAAFLTLSSLLALQAGATAPLSAALTLPDDKVLPGVPFDIVVTYTNVSARPVTISGARATLIVTFANGEAKVMHEPEGQDQWDIQASVPVRLQPGESVQHAASWENGSIPNWFRYDSFSGPGIYGIALDLRVADADHQPLGTIRTPAVTLTRVEPTGIDAELWKRMLAVSSGKWSDSWFKTKEPGYALAGEIIQLYPSSGYYPYVLALRSLGRGVDKNHIPALLEAAERFPTSPAHPYLLNAAANCARYAGWVAKDAGSTVDAERYFKLAETKYREALATKSVSIRKSSELELRNVVRELDRGKQKVR